MDSILPQWRLTAPAGLSLAAARRRSGADVAAAYPADLGPRETYRSTMPQAMGRVIRPEASSRWLLPQLSAMTPAYVQQVLSAALAGDHSRAAELFSLMEDTWPRLAKNLNDLKRSVVRLHWQVEPWHEDDAAPTPSAEERAKLVSHAVWRMRPEPGTDEEAFPGLLYDLLDAWAKGLSVVELLWETTETKAFGRVVLPRASVWVDPQMYAWGADGRIVLRPYQPLAPLGQPRPGADVGLPEHKFLIARCKARSGHPLAGALLRPLAWWWCASNFSADWLLNLGQLFGLPFRWANYAAGASESTIDAVCSMLENAGSAGWALFPEGTTLQLVESSKGVSSYPQADMLDRADRQCDILILGQTLTTDVADSGSRALGDVHADVRQDVILSAAEWLESVLNTQLIPSVLALNYGTDEEAPEIEGKPHKAEDRRGNAERDEILLRAGVAFPRDWFYERHDIPLPQAGEPVITGAAPGPLPGALGGPGLPPDGMQAARSAPNTADPTDAVVTERRSALAALYRGTMAPFREAVLASTSPEDAMARVTAIYRDWRPERLAAELEDALQILAAHGCGHGAAH